MDLSFYFVGGGRAGAGLCFYLAGCGFPVAGLVETNRSRYAFLKEKFGWPFLREQVNPEDLRKARLVLLIVPDDEIAGLAETLSQFPLDWETKIVAHTSGVLPSGILAPFQHKGAAIASVHPLFSFSENPEQNRELPRAWFNLEGDETALTCFESVFRLTGNPNFRVTPYRKSAIHLSGVFYANFFVALASAAEELTEELLPVGQNIFSVLRPLLLSAMGQLQRVGVKEGLTGPVKRGDVTTVRTHLKFLKEKHPELVDLYRVLSYRLIASGDLPEEKREELLQLLENNR